MYRPSEHDEPPAISIVLPTFDRPDALTLCLDALLLQQTLHHFEVLIIDNHPQSGLTAPLTARYADIRYPNIRWLQEPIAGLSQARNHGVAAARGRIIVTTDDDVILPPDWLDRLTAPLFAAEADPAHPLAAVTGNCLPLKVETEAEALFEAYGGLQHGSLPATFDAAWMAQWRVGFPHLWRIGTTANAAFLASALRDPRIQTSAGPFETLLGAGSPAGAYEDLYCFYLLLRAGYRIQYLPEAAVRHAHRDTLPALIRQLCAYRRGETAFLALILERHGDLRTLGQALLWIPQWRARLFLGELLRRLTDRHRFSFRVFWLETLAYFQGPSALRRAQKAATPLPRATAPAADTPSR
jgi:glycosyltransferase involved in cell wall biosynthesis